MKEGQLHLDRYLVWYGKGKPRRFRLRQHGEYWEIVEDLHSKIPERSFQEGGGR